MFGPISSAGSALRTTTLGLVIGAAVLIAPAAVAAHAGPAPANDTFDAATQISFLPFEDGFVENSFASVEEGELDVSCIHEIDATVWYRIDPSSSYGLRVRVLPESNNIDVVLAMYAGSYLGDLYGVGCVDNAGPDGNETLDVPVSAGQSYFIQVGGWSGDNTVGEFTVRVKRLPAPVNDNFRDALSAPLGSISNTSTIAATTQANEPSSSCGYYNGRTVWYRFTPSTTRTIVANTVGSDFDTVLAVYTGDSLASLSEVTCNDDRGIDLLSKVRFTALGGVTYYFQIAGFYGSSGNLQFRLKAP